MYYAYGTYEGRTDGAIGVEDVENKRGTLQCPHRVQNNDEARKSLRDTKKLTGGGEGRTYDVSATELIVVSNTT